MSGQEPDVWASAGGRNSKALGRWGQELVSAGDSDMTDKRPPSPGQHKVFSLPS